jgi:hypothetical protein
VIIAVRNREAGLRIVTVVPITHSVPHDTHQGIELPPQLKSHLGLDTERSFVIVAEVNSFIWPGPDLRPVSRRRPGVFHYGALPPRFFMHIKSQLLQVQAQGRLRHVERDE